MRTQLPVLAPLLVLSLVLLVVVPPGRAQEETCDHLISLPGSQAVGYVISAPGIYCLETDVIMAASFTSGNAIEIAANYVTLNLKGHKVHGAAAGTTTGASGIFADNRRNILVKNGIVWGFAYGVSLTAVNAMSVTGYVVEGIRAELNKVVGIDVGGANAIVRHNVVAYTGPWGLPGNTDTFGIRLFSSGGRALDNDVLVVTPKGSGIGGGIQTVSGQDVLIIGNRITKAQYGVRFASSAGKYRDNLTSGVTIPFTGGTNAGNNN